MLIFSLHATAQEPIDFSGVWQMDPSRSESAHQATPIGSFTLVIKQAATELSIETRRGGWPMVNQARRLRLKSHFSSSEQPFPICHALDERSSMHQKVRQKTAIYLLTD